MSHNPSLTAKIIIIRLKEKELLRALLIILKSATTYENKEEWEEAYVGLLTFIRIYHLHRFEVEDIGAAIEAYSTNPKDF